MTPSRAFGWTLLGALTLALILVPFLLGEGAVFELSRTWLARPASRGVLAAVVVALLAADLFLPIALLRRLEPKRTQNAE